MKVIFMAFLSSARKHRVVCTGLRHRSFRDLFMQI